MKLNKVSRLLFSIAALLLGNVLANWLGSPVFFLLGVALCVYIFGFLGRKKK